MKKTYIPNHENFPELPFSAAVVTAKRFTARGIMVSIWIP